MAEVHAPEAILSDIDEKKVAVDVDTENNESSLDEGHLQELEVDLDGILKEDGEEDIDGEHSPYAEGK